MTQTFTLTAHQYEEFERRGLLRLEGLLSAERVGAAREAVLRPLERLGLWWDGAWRLDRWPKPQWPASGLKTARVIGNKRPELEALIEEPALLAVVDRLLEGRPFDRGIYKRPQLLFTLPNIETWALPAGWHLDVPRLASGEGPGVQVFIFLDAVGPGGGGTLVIAGSHRLLNDGRFHKTGKVMKTLRREGFFADLCSGALDGGEGLPSALGDDDVREGPRLDDMVAQIGPVDRLPDHLGEAARPRLVQVTEAGVEGGRIVLGGAPEADQPLGEPGLEVRLVGVEIDQRVDQAAMIGVQAEPLDDQHTRRLQCPGQRRVDIVGDVRIGRKPCRPTPDRGQGRAQAFDVVAFGEALALGKATRLQGGVVHQKAVGADDLHRRPIRLGGEVGGELAGEDALARRDAAGDGDHIGSGRRPMGAEQVADVG